MNAMSFHVKIGGLSGSLRSSASRTRLMLPCDRILMSPFAISVSSVPNSIEEDADGARVVQVRHVRCRSNF